MSEEIYETTFETPEDCSHDCGSCSASCGSRQDTPESFLEPVNQYSRVQRVIGVVSGKGGVGKSFVTSYTATCLRRKGYKTAILDADITGPSIPKAFGLHTQAAGNETGIFPVNTKLGTKVMSVNLLLDNEETPVIWRGPVIAGTVKQFWTDVIWGNVNYMFVDMPPGTGDVPLTVFQSLPLDGIIIVTSPQELVSMIVAKAIGMAKAMSVPVLGIVENYSYVECPDCKKQIEVFGKSHIEEAAAKYNIPVLGKIPLTSSIAEAIDNEKIEDLEGDWLNTAVETIEFACPAEAFGEVNEFDEYNKDMKPIRKLAVTCDDKDCVGQHFGSCSKFVIYTLDDGSRLSGREVITTDKTGHDELSRLMKDNEVEVLICGGIGQGAMDALFSAGILVVPGQMGNVDKAVAAFLDGSMQTSTEPVCSGHKEGEGCGCGCGCV